jgi:hypothetical protein
MLAGSPNKRTLLNCLHGWYPCGWLLAQPQRFCHKLIPRLHCWHVLFHVSASQAHSAIITIKIAACWREAAWPHPLRSHAGVGQAPK